MFSQTPGVGIADVIDPTLHAGVELRQADPPLCPVGEAFSDSPCGLCRLARFQTPMCRIHNEPEPGHARLYRLYLHRLLPRIGNGVSGGGGDSAYGYLARTIAGFPEPEVLAGRIRESGFAACGWRTRTAGIVAIHTAFKGDR